MAVGRRKVEKEGHKFGTDQMIRQYPRTAPTPASTSEQLPNLFQIGSTHQYSSNMQCGGLMSAYKWMQRNLQAIKTRAKGSYQIPRLLAFVAFFCSFKDGTVSW